MASLNKIETIQVHTTPTELRKLANEMENKWNLVKIGESTKAVVWNGTNINIEFHFDQEALADEKRQLDEEVSVDINLIKPRRKDGERLLHAAYHIFENIRSQGIRTPILVDENYNIIDGDVRYHAAVKLGWKTIVVRVKKNE